MVRLILKKTHTEIAEEHSEFDFYGTYAMAVSYTHLDVYKRQT